MKSQEILIAYPDDQGTQSFMSVFREAGYCVEKTAVVSDLIRKVRGGGIEVILLDDVLEGVKACDLVPLLKKINGKIQVIVISSEESLCSARRLREAGIFYQAMKPVDVEELKSAVECAFEKIEREHPMPAGLFPFLMAEGVRA